MKSGLGLLAAICVICTGVTLGSSFGGDKGPSARRQVNIPPAWGQFVGGSNYGLAFRDNHGTIRFLIQLPRGLEGWVNLELEIKRK